MNDKDQLIELTEGQQNPGLAMPTDFVVRSYSEELSQPFHGQCGDSETEYNALLPQNRPLPTRNDVDHTDKS